MSRELAEVIVENGITYYLAENGCYYPDLRLEQKTDYLIGKYGMMRAEYLMDYQRHRYLKMVMEGTWNAYLHEVDEECHKEIEKLAEQMKEKEGVTEELKAIDQMKWVGMVNNIRSCAEEIVLEELVYV